MAQTTVTTKTAATATIRASVNDKTAKSETPAAPAQQQAQGRTHLFILVETFDKDGKRVGDRIVDLYHIGTREWMSNHNWWAMHNGHNVEVRNADDKEIAEYLKQGTERLAEKFNSKAA